MLPRLIFFFITLSFSQYHSNEWSSITSYLTPTQISISDDGKYYASTSGGLLVFDPISNKFSFLDKKNGLISLELLTIKKDDQGRLWLGGAYPNGHLQVFDIDNEVIKVIDYLEEISEISMIEIGADKAYAVFAGFSIGDVGVLEFVLNNNGLPDYKDYYTNFNGNNITEIRDLDYFNDSLYITTDQGIFSAHHNDNLKYSNNWNIIYNENNAIKFIPTDENNYIITESSIINFRENITINLFGKWPYCDLPDSEGNLVTCPSPNSDDYCINYTGDGIVKNLGNCGAKILSANWQNNQFEILFDRLFLVMDSNGTELYKLEVPYSQWEHYRSKYTSVENDEEKIVLGLEKYGFLVFDNLSGSYELYSPNTPHVNEYYAINFTSTGNLAAVSQNGLLIVENIYSDYKIYHNLLSYPDYKYFPKNYEQNNFHNTPMIYHVGKYPTHSIIEDKRGKLIFGNSYLRPRESWYDFPAIIELDQSTFEFVSYDTTNQVIDGYWGISTNPPIKNMNMVINELSIDKRGNLWVANPYCEKDTNIVAIKLNDSQEWQHVKGPDSNSFRPQTIGLDNYNKAWIGFAYHIIDDNVYSSGGIKVLQYSNISSDSWQDSLWISIGNPEKLPGDDSNASVWSIVFDKMNFAWIMNDKGIRGYTYYLEDNKIMLDPLLKSIDGTAYDFLPNVSFISGNRIRVDSQNNKWIITHQGVWVIQESMAFWPSEEGLNTDNSDILSDKIYDVDFDNNNGIAFIATDMGISTLQIPFSNNPSKKETIYISPNPFIIPNDEFVIIKNVPSGSKIKITTINGILIKSISLSPNQSQFIWDGRDKNGTMVGTAVYLVSSHNPDFSNMVSKIAVIRN